MGERGPGAIEEPLPFTVHFEGENASKPPLKSCKVSGRTDMVWSDPDSNRDVVVEFDGLNRGACTIRTLRHGPYKYGLNLVHQDQLYDLDAAPWETNNLIEHPDYQDIARDLRERLFEWMKQADDQVLCAFRTAYPEAR